MEDQAEAQVPAPSSVQVVLDPPASTAPPSPPPAPAPAVPPSVESLRRELQSIQQRAFHACLEASVSRISTLETRIRTLETEMSDARTVSALEAALGGGQHAAATGSSGASAQA